MLQPFQLSNVREEFPWLEEIPDEEQQNANPECRLKNCRVSPVTAS